MQINAGVFNKKIQVIRYEITKDSDGFETKTEITVLNTWAQVTNISGTELLRSNSDFSEIYDTMGSKCPELLAFFCVSMLWKRVSKENFWSYPR